MPLSSTGPMPSYLTQRLSRCRLSLVHVADQFWACREVGVFEFEEARLRGPGQVWYQAGSGCWQASLAAAGIWPLHTVLGAGSWNWKLRVLEPPFRITGTRIPRGVGSMWARRWPGMKSSRLSPAGRLQGGPCMLGSGLEDTECASCSCARPLQRQPGGRAGGRPGAQEHPLRSGSCLAQPRAGGGEQGGAGQHGLVTGSGRWATGGGARRTRVAGP